jgi:pimeloyl-ACP methyl ester carboxylesterase
VFGNSLGGAVCTRLAAERPELVRTLTLISPALPDRRPREGTDWRLGALLVPGLANAITWYLGRAPATSRTRAVVELCFAHPDLVPQERLDEAVAEMERRRGLAWSEDALVRSLRGLIGTYVEHGPRALWRQAAAVTAPTLLIWGRHDRLVHPAVGARAVRVFRRARLVVYEHCGHVAQMEDPRAVAAEWRKFVADAGDMEPTAGKQADASA